MERPATIALPEREGREGWALEGLFCTGESAEMGGAVVAPAHPLYGGSIELPVVSELTYTCEKAGVASLRFNWRGVGASAGRPSGDMDEGVEDYHAALDFLEETVSPPLIAAGYSFGAAIAIAASDRVTVRRLILVAPPPVMLNLEMLRSFKGKVFIAVGENDALAPPSELEKIAEGLENARLRVLDETDHFFMTGTGLSDLRREVSAWL
jgi:alpha/beta superfamily hydrolase